MGVERACQTGAKAVDSPEMKGTEGLREETQETLEGQAGVGQPHREVPRHGRGLGKQWPSTVLRT